MTRRRGRPAKLKPWLLRIHNNGYSRELIIIARSRAEAEEQAKFILKQSFPLARGYTLKKLPKSQGVRV